MKTLNLLLCRTGPPHPQDEWIALGVRHLLRRLFAGRSLRWRRCGGTPVEHTGGAEYTAGGIDLAIGIGAAEWHGPHFRTLLELAGRIACPWLFMAVEHRHRDVRLAAAEYAVLCDALVVARCRPTYNALSAARIANLLLPCPSLFSASRENPARALRSVAVLVAPRRPSEHVPGSPAPALHAAIDALARRYDVRILCAAASDFFVFAERWPRLALFCPTADAQLAHLSTCDAAVTSDETCAFVAHSVLKPAILLDSERSPSPPAELFPYLVTAPPCAVLDELARLDIDSLPRHLLNWKRRVEDHYLAILSQWVSAHDLRII